MEEKLIVAVCNQPWLYDTVCDFYWVRSRTDLAWRRVSKEVGLAEDVCRKKWKDLMDTYLKERRKSQEERSGSATGTSTRWKYSALMSFLNPFVSPKNMRSNMVQQQQGVEEDGTAEYGQPSETGEVNNQTDEGEDAGSDVGAAAESPARTSAAEPSGERAKKRPRQGPSEVEQLILQALRTPPPPPPALTEDEMFLRSLLPALQKVPPEIRDHVKFKMYKLIVDNHLVTR